MTFNEFMEFISENTTFMPDGYKLVPVVSLGYPKYSVWMLDHDTIERMTRG